MYGLNKILENHGFNPLQQENFLKLLHLAGYFKPTQLMKDLSTAEFEDGEIDNIIETIGITTCPEKIFTLTTDSPALIEKTQQWLNITAQRLKETRETLFQKHSDEINQIIFNFTKSTLMEKKAKKYNAILLPANSPKELIEHLNLIRELELQYHHIYLLKGLNETDEKYVPKNELEKLTCCSLDKYLEFYLLQEKVTVINSNLSDFMLALINRSNISHSSLSTELKFLALLTQLSSNFLVVCNKQEYKTYAQSLNQMFIDDSQLTQLNKPEIIHPTAPNNVIFLDLCDMVIKHPIKSSESSQTISTPTPTLPIQTPVSTMKKPVRKKRKPHTEQADTNSSGSKTGTYIFGTAVIAGIAFFSADRATNGGSTQIASNFFDNILSNIYKKFKQ